MNRAHNDLQDAKIDILTLGLCCRTVGLGLRNGDDDLEVEEMANDDESRFEQDTVVVLEEDGA